MTKNSGYRRGVDRINENNMSNQHGDLEPDECLKITPHIRSKNRKPVSTSTKQLTGYFTVNGIQSEISYRLKDWPIFALKELMDNAYDFLNDFYPITAAVNKDDSNIRRTISVFVKLNPPQPDLGIRIIRIAVRNSNVDSESIFEDLDQIFDYTQWQSSKRNQHRMNCGSLGDFLKRAIGMGYASLMSLTADSSDNNNNNDSGSDDKQWEQPLILRFHHKEYRVLASYDIYTGVATPDVQGPYKSEAVDNTEVEVALPVSIANCKGAEYDESPLLDRLRDYYEIYILAKTRTHFNFTIGKE
jgi:hypothetical protein